MPSVSEDPDNREMRVGAPRQQEEGFEEKEMTRVGEEEDEEEEEDEKEEEEAKSVGVTSTRHRPGHSMDYMDASKGTTTRRMDRLDLQKELARKAKVFHQKLRDFHKKKVEEEEENVVKLALEASEASEASGTMSDLVVVKSNENHTSSLVAMVKFVSSMLGDLVKSLEMSNQSINQHPNNSGKAVATLIAGWKNSNSQDSASIDVMGGAPNAIMDEACTDATRMLLDVVISVGEGVKDTSSLLASIACAHGSQKENTKKALAQVRRVEIR